MRIFKRLVWVCLTACISQPSLANTASNLTTTITQTITQTINQNRDVLYQAQESTQPAVSISFDGQFDTCRDEFYQQTAPTLVGTAGKKLSTLAQPLCFAGFATLHSGIARTPLWSASRLSKQRIQQARQLPRVDNFHPELRLAATERAELVDYRRSGLDRGHIAPNGDMADSESQYASFSLANIAPQNGEHNRNVWRHIEIATRTLAIQYGEIYVVTGVAFLGKTSERIGGRVLVPSHFFKAVYIPSLSAAGVYFSPNDATGKYQIISLSELASMTGINAMPTLPMHIQNAAYGLPAPMTEKQAEQVLEANANSWLQLAHAAWRYLVEFLNRT